MHQLTENKVAGYRNRIRGKELSKSVNSDGDCASSYLRIIELLCCSISLLLCCKFDCAKTSAFTSMSLV